MEELKKDVESVKQLSAHKSFLENVNDLSILKTRPVSRHQQPPTPTALQHPHHAEVLTAAHTHGNHITGHYSSTTSTATSSGRLSTQSGNILSTQQLPQSEQQHLNITTPATTTTTRNACNEKRDDISNSSGSYEESLQQQQQQNRNLQINHSRG